MPKIVIEGMPQYNGSYDLDVSTFSGRELHTIKEISGVRAGELQEAFAAGDYDLVVALTVIVLRRAGKTVDADEIMDADVGSINVDVTDAAEMEEERPPVSPTPNGRSTSSDGVGNENGGTETSGSRSSDAGDEPANVLRAIGSPS